MSYLYKLINTRNEINYEAFKKNEIIECLVYMRDAQYSLKLENQELKKDIKNIIKILNKNCDDLEATEEEFESLERWENE